MKTDLADMVCAVALALFAFGGLQGAVVNFRADRATCVYETGETAKLSVTVAETNGIALTSGHVRLVVDNFGNVRSEEREIDLAEGNPFEVRVSRTEPGFARLTVTPADPVQKLEGGVFGVGFSPEKIVSGTPEPADFDAFWSEAIAKLDRTVPVDAKMELVPENSKGERNYYRVSFATCRGRRVYGWLSEPKDLSRGPFPVRVSVPGAGIGALSTGGDGRTISLTMNVHSYPQPEDEGPYDGGERRRLYDAQDARYAKPNGVARYCQAGIHRSREDYFYYASILGINRAVNWLAARPECDRGDFTYSGTSQGGGFGLMLTALNPHITKSCIFVPAITDLLGYKVGDRQSGWPRLIEAQRPENRAAAERWAPYFCGVNFARRIRGPIRFVAGFADNTCSPNAVYSAFNACPSTDKGILDGIGMGHRVYGEFYTYLGAWARTRTDAKPQYRFLAFNIWGDFFGNPPHERDHREAQVIRNWNPDIVGFQEVTANFWTSRLFPSLEGDYGVVGRGLGPDAAHRDAANPILYRRSRFDLVDSGADWFCPELDYSKGAVWAVLKDRSTGAKIVAFASHFWWQYKGIGDDWIRLQNARRLTALVKGLARKHNAAIIGGGDLNAAMESDAMKSIVADGLADAQATAAVSPKSFHTDHYDPRRDAKGAYHGVPAVRGMADKVWSLDHVFYDPATVSVSRFDLDITPEACALSDHHPIVADFNLKKPEPAEIGERVLPSGVREITEPIVIDAASGGTETRRLVIRSADSAHPAVISGGRRITGWRVLPDGSWSVILPEVKSGALNFSQLYADGVRRFRPRMPQEGWYRTEKGIGIVTNGYGSVAGFVYEGDVIDPKWANRGDLEIVTIQKWNVARMRIGDLWPERRELVFSKPRPCKSGHSSYDGKTFRVENVKEAFGRKGEWYLDRPTGELRYMPMDGEAPERTVIEIPVAKRLLEIRGARNVEFRDIVFRLCDLTTGPEGSFTVQGAHHVPAAVALTDSSDIEFRGCVFTQLGGQAISFGPGSHDCAVEDSLIRDIGAGAVKIGSIDREDTHHITVRNCVLTGLGRWHPDGCGVMILRSSYNRVLHNEISDLFYTGVSLGWDWSSAPTMAHHNEVGWNHIRDVGQKVLSDMGGVYLLGQAPGTSVHDNWIHDITAATYGGNGIYPDYGSAFLDICGNVVSNVVGGFQGNSGRDIRLCDNVFLDTKEFAVQWSSFFKATNTVIRMERNRFGWGSGVLFIPGYDLVVPKERFGEWDRPLGHGMDSADNRYWRYDGKRDVFPDGRTLEAWQKESGRDAGSTFGAFDPDEVVLPPAGPLRGIRRATWPEITVAFPY